MNPANVCPDCSAANPDDARFCSSCGNRLGQACPACGQAVTQDAGFCNRCGERLKTSPEAPVASSNPGTEQASTKTPPLETSFKGGENRLVSVLFADMSGSVETTRNLDAEEAATLVDSLLRAMVDAVTRYGGRVDRFLGDGVLAVFGTPTTHEDDAQRAIRAALDIRDAAAREGFTVSAGVNTGEVYFGDMGPDAHRETTVMGPVVNLAARLQGQAGPGGIIVGEATMQQARGAFDFEAMSVHVKGHDEAVPCFRVHKAVARPDKARGFEGTRVPLVAREDETARLLRAYEDVAGGNGGRVVTLVGEAGVGKSRLLAELKARAVKDGALWLEGRCSEMSSGTGYAPFVDLFSEHFGCRTIEDDRVRGARIKAHLDELAARGQVSPEERDDLIPLIGRLLSVQFGDDRDKRLAGIDPEKIRNWTYRAIPGLFAAYSRERPVTLVLEDLHWADTLSVGLVTSLLESVRENPASVLIVCAYRPERDHPAYRLAATAAQKCAGRHTDLQLRELTPESCKELVEVLLEEEGVPKGLDALIFEKTRGNPFFVEEVIRALRDSGVLTGGGEWDKQDDGADIVIPASLQSVILSRVDTLNAETRNVLQCAAVVGRIFRPVLLARLVDPNVDLAAVLRLLEDRGLVYLERLVPEEEWSFKHAFTQEIVYKGILKRNRASFHDRVGHEIVTLYAGDALDQHYEEVAYHFERGNDAANAARYLCLAGEKSKRAYLNEEAADTFRRALDQAAKMPEDSEVRTRLELRALDALAGVFVTSALFDQALETVDRALQLIEGDKGHLQAVLLQKRAMALGGLKRPDEAEAAYEAAETALGPMDDSTSAETRRLWTAIQHDRVFLHYFHGELATVDALIGRISPIVQKFGTVKERGLLTFSTVLARLRHGRYAIDEEILDLYHQTVADAEEAGDPPSIALMHFGYGFGLLWAGLLDAAEGHLARARSMANRVGDVVIETRAIAYLAVHHRLRGHVESARPLIEESFETAEAREMSEYVGSAHACKAWLARCDGDDQAARDHAETALEIWSQRYPPYPFSWLAEFLLMDIAVIEERFADAKVHATNILQPKVQRLPQDLTDALERARDLDGDQDGGPVYKEILEIARRRSHL